MNTMSNRSERENEDNSKELDFLASIGTRWEVSRFLSKALFYVAGVATVGSFIWIAVNEDKTKRLDNISYQNLPAEIRHYDTNRNGYFDAGEMDQLMRDFELKRK